MLPARSFGSRDSIVHPSWSLIRWTQDRTERIRRVEKQASGSVTVSETSAVSKLVPGGEDGTGVSFGRSVARSQWRSVLLAAHCLLQSCANALGIVKTSKGQKGNMKITSRDEGLEISVASLPRVWVHVSLPVVAIMITLPLWHGFHPQKLIAAAIIVVGVIASIFAHELRHALMARRLGLKPVLIKLHSGGGEAIWEGESWTRTQDRLITIAGPFVNLILGGACLASYALFLPDASSPFQPSVERSWITPPPMADPPLFRALNWLGWINIILAVVNLLPAFPLDGGRLLSSVIEGRWGPQRAMFWVGLFGTALALIAKFVFFCGILMGMVIWSPPHFAPNWRALRLSRLRKSKIRVSPTSGRGTVIRLRESNPEQRDG
ncbi:putative transmembrane protein [Sinorhizobium fredii HH103]|uniref:Transmembrane protein n=2 Tax=Rhizobium fredii TaxID=380 RepID=G9AAV9_SINF1|nr:putative transmembrane protein [Sinorhizobium fredii HH103]